MSEKRWTPGPWVVNLEDDHQEIVAGGWAIMGDMTYYPWTPGNDADWHLISAAPCLYEALERLMVECIIEGLEDKAGFDCWILMAKEAMRKARGEA